MTRSGRAGVVAFVAVLGAAGCRQSERAGTAVEAESPDTGVFGGLTPEQIRRRVEPMSPAQAESLGIVDSTIHVEPDEATDSGQPAPQGRPLGVDTTG